MHLTRSGTAEWMGDLTSGGGAVSTGSGAIEGCFFGAGTRFEAEPGANPEELLGAAHAACFGMQLSGTMERAGFKPQNLEVIAHISIRMDTSGAIRITGSHLEVRAIVHGIGADHFKEIARLASRTCPMSRALDIPVTVDARLC